MAELSKEERAVARANDDYLNAFLAYEDAKSRGIVGWELYKLRRAAWDAWDWLATAAEDLEPAGRLVHAWAISSDRYSVQQAA